MDTLHLLTITSNSSLVEKIQEIIESSDSSTLSQPIQIDQLSSLSGDLSREIQLSPQVVLIDLASFPGKETVVFQMVREDFSNRAVILLTEKDRVELPPNPPSSDLIYFMTTSDLSNSLFPVTIKYLSTITNLTTSNREIQHQLDNRVNELLSLRKASLHLTLNLSLDSVLEAILESALELLSANDTHIFLYEHGVLSFGAALFDGHQQKKPFMNPRAHGGTYKVAKEGVMLVVDDVMSDPLFEDNRWEGSIIMLPLKIGNQVLGVMNVALSRTHEFSENEIRALEFLGDQASIAIQNAKLYEQAQQEIIDRKKAEKAIKHLANHDALTGLPNRRLFNERINLEISRAQRNAQIIGIMLFDLDHLKLVNDSYGHNIGDLLLQAIAQRLLGLLRKSDTIARMGGDEFLLILPEMSQTQDAIQTAERILAALSNPFHLEAYEVTITTSIGVAFFPEHGITSNVLVKKADIAMYKAKEKGGNVYHLYTE